MKEVHLEDLKKYYIEREKDELRGLQVLLVTLMDEYILLSDDEHIVSMVQEDIIELLEEIRQLNLKQQQLKIVP